MKSDNRNIEKIKTHIYDDSSQASKAVASEIVELIKAKAKKGEHCVLGLATGSSPMTVYKELIRLHKEDNISFKNVITFNLDEYYPMRPEELQSYVHFMNEYLFDHIDIPKENINIPDGTIPKDKIDKYCRLYEEKIKSYGGIDIQLLGIGRTGHIGFNEPGSGMESRTRLVTLDHITRIDAASDFFGEENVPNKALTMGVGTILDAKRIILLAWGEQKDIVVKEAVEGEISDEVPATYLQNHKNTTFVIDATVGAELTRIKTPWLLGPCDWNEELIRKAVIWLYRGAWQEWDIYAIEMAVPLSPDELLKKRRAIFKHQSQKDRPLFPGHDMREFWQRSEARNRHTAELYDQLGLAEYEAIEAFKKFKL